ncbi:MAG: ABC transporter permease [Desulfurococcales archaeon]|nr:ABC transporter permease [Desulfurococcales archaeon]
MSKSIAIFLKDLKQYYLKAPVLSWGFLFPIAIIVLLTMTVKSYGESIMVPAMFSVSLLFASTSMAQVAVSFEKMNGSIYRLVYAPLTGFDLVASKTLGGLFYGLIGVFIATLSVYLFTGHLIVIHILYFIASIILGSLLYSLMSVLIALTLDPLKTVATLNIARFSMIFFGGMIIPQALLPHWMQELTLAFPSLYITDSIRYGMYNSWETVDPYTSLIITLIITFTLYIIAYRTALKSLTP